MVYLGIFMGISGEGKVGEREVDHSNDSRMCPLDACIDFLSMERTSFKTNLILEGFQISFESY